MKKKIWPLVALMLVAAMLLAGCSLNWLKSFQLKWQADQHLKAGNYEEALSAYDEMLVLDNGNVSAYIGIAKALAGLGDYEEAVQTLQEGVETTASEELAQMLGEYELEAIRQKETEEGMQELEQAFDRMKTSFTEGKAYEVVAVLRGGLMDDVPEESFGEEGYVYSGEKNAEGRQHGTGLALYANGCCYYGEWQNGKRNGTGYWVSTYSRMMAGGTGSWKNTTELAQGGTVYHGEWANDAPNGNGVEECYDGDRLIWRAEGNFSKGVYDGAFRISAKDMDSEVAHWLIFSQAVFAEGKPEELASYPKGRNQVVEVPQGCFVIASATAEQAGTYTYLYAKASSKWGLYDWVKT